MRSIKRILALCLALCITALFPAPVNGAHEQVIYDQISPAEFITSGVTLERVKRFTTDGWLGINILSVDLSNPYIKVDAITSQDAAGKASNTKNLVTSSGAVAAINASFFNTASDPVGLVVKSGNTIAADATLNKNGEVFGTLAINDLYQAFCSYWKTGISISSPSGKQVEAARYNKPHYYIYKDITIQDRKMFKTSLGTTNPAAYPDFTEMVVKDGRVAEIRIAKPAVQIPENGFVVIAGTSKGRRLITENFKPGEPVVFNLSSTPNTGRLQTGLTGGSLLVRDGQIPSSFPHIPEGGKSTNNPRTAIGTSKDGKKLIMVTVDGRQQSSTGLTLHDLAVLMKQIGCYTAINFDGGGSTTMVARKEASQAIEVVNSPSDGSLRNVATALGVFSIAPPGELEGLVVEAVDKNVFVNTSREFTVRGYDRYLNPIPVDQRAVKWTVTGAAGSFTGNRLIPTTEGRAFVSASIGRAAGSMEINVLSPPVELDLGVRSLKLETDQTKVFGITGKSRDGYSANINYKDVKWSVNGNIGEFKDNIFIANGQGTGYVDAAAGTAHAYCGISVPVMTPSVKDNFEKSNGYFYSYPVPGKGDYGISSEIKYSGSSSGKLSYDFSEEIGAGTAYFYFDKGGLSLDASAVSLGLWVYNDRKNTNRLRAEVLDKNGKLQLLNLSDNMDWTGWKYVELPLKSLALPATFYSISTQQVAPKTEAGLLYLDDLTVTTSGYNTLDVSKVPANTTARDEDYKSTVYIKSPGSFRFSVFGMAADPRNELERVLISKLADKINKYIEVGAFVGSKGQLAAPGVTKPVVAPNRGYNSFVYQSSRFIQLDMSRQGLRLTDSSQWTWLLQQLASSREDNLFLFLSGSPESFSDSAEAGLLQDILSKQQKATGQSIWVIHGSNKNTSFMKNGIKYVTSAGFDTGSFDWTNTDNAKYMLVVVKGKTVTYEYKPIIS